ncbi:Protein of unknown function [Pseudomonas benzenivorans]|nr:hypothetical protein [Pseudomonas benzenivorans]SDG52544.1 Protein of unknown function [Pseudomonas benzenivorans]
MNIFVLLRMLFCSTSVSAELACHGSAIRNLFWAVIVLLSLLPPAMIVLLDGPLSACLPVLQIRPSVFMASLFFGCEVLSVFLMGWLIKQVASTLGHEVAYADAYLVAAIAPIPLWLSSLGLLVNNPFLNTALPLSALASCCALIYQGGVLAVPRREPSQSCSRYPGGVWRRPHPVDLISAAFLVCRGVSGSYRLNFSSPT